MCWYERRKPLYEMILELHYSKEQKEELTKDENGRELPEWLREAAEKEQSEKAVKLTKYTQKGQCLNLCLNYGFKLVFFIQYLITFTNRSKYYEL